MSRTHGITANGKAMLEHLRWWPDCPTCGKRIVAGLITMAGGNVRQCSLCSKFIDTPFETPDDPPFFPAGGGRHCQSCETWLQTGRDE